MARQIAAQDPGGLIGKNLTLSYAGRTSDGEVDPTTGFQVRRVDLVCRLVGVVERDVAPLAIGGRPALSVVIPDALAEAIDAGGVTNAQSLLRVVSEPKTYGSLT